MTRITAAEFLKMQKGYTPAKKPGKAPAIKAKSSEVETDDDEPLMSGQYSESEIRRVFNCLTDAKVIRLLGDLGFYYVDSGAEKLEISNGKTTYQITIKAA